MDSWQNVNYLAGNRTLWVHFMNRSTQDWGIGYFPPKVFALPGQLNRSKIYPDDALIVEFAGVSRIGAGELEVVIYGLISSIAIIWAALRIIYTWKNAKFQLKNASTDDIMTAAKSQRLLNTKFYESVASEIEMFDSDDENHCHNGD